MPFKPHGNEGSAGRIATGQALLEANNLKNLILLLVFCCVDFVTSTKSNLVFKIDLPASLWRDSFTGPKHERSMQSVFPVSRTNVINVSNG